MQQLKMVKEGRVSEEEARYTESGMVFEVCKDMAKLDREHFVVLHLDNKNRIIARETVSIGTLNQAIIHPREVFKAAVHNGSAAIICVHNHPSGDSTPSAEDKEIVQRLDAAGKIIGIRVLDHIIIGDGQYFSEQDWLNQQQRKPLKQKSASWHSLDAFHLDASIILKRYPKRKLEHPDAVLFIDFVDFWVFQEDALLVARLLNLPLESVADENGKDAPFLFLPYKTESNFIDKVVEAGHKVAICTATGEEIRVINPAGTIQSLQKAA